MFAENRTYAGVYWGDRKASLDEVTAQVSSLLEELARVSPGCARWYVRKDSKDESLQHPAEAGVVRAAMVARMDEPADFDRYGFMLELWNGSDEAPMHLELTLGAHLDLPHCPAPNACVLQFPPDARDLEPRLLEQLLGTLAEVTAADWGLVSNPDRLRQATMELGPGAPHLGWVTFLTRARGRLPALGAEVQVVGRGHGHLITVPGPEFETVANRIEDLLLPLGLLAAVNEYTPVADAHAGGIEVTDPGDDHGHALAISFLHHVLRGFVGADGFVFGTGAAFASAADLSVVLPGRGRTRSLAIEVVSANPTEAGADRITRVSAHGAAEVPWVWLVDPQLRSLEVLERGADGRFTRALATTEGRVEGIPGCEGLVLDLEALWSEIARFRR
ncbi:MAG: Uma2 family endonuclease [Myxococcales bacterium]|nr:Uma2 family endonuclease [Myxococcales bacterium]